MFRRVDNPPNPWQRFTRDWLGEPPRAEVEIYEESCRDILSENKSPDLNFRYSLNPYRGCYHACAYCYARTTHEYLDFGAGSDFETKLVVKTNAPERLRERLASPRFRRERIVFSGATDAYQPLEAHYELTKRCLEVCEEFANPVGIVTKSGLIRRDVELLERLSQRASVSVYLSIPFIDSKMARAIEPTAPSPEARFRALRVLSDAGLETGVAVAPIIVGLNDHQVTEILERAAAAGARRAFRVPLRLVGSVRPVFLSKLEQSYPNRYQKIVDLLEEAGRGDLTGGGFGQRFRGRGKRWEVIDQLFESGCRRFGLDSTRQREAHDSATPPTPPQQLELF